MLSKKEKLELTASVHMLERLEKALTSKRKVATAWAEKADRAAGEVAQLDGDCAGLRERISELRSKDAEKAIA